MIDDSGVAIEIGRRQTETFRRIDRLYSHGFRPDLPMKAEGAIWWSHLGGYPDLILYPDGKLVAVNGRAVLSPGSPDGEDRIYNDADTDVAHFDRWLRSVPKPTWWQAGSYARERYIWMPGCTVAMLGFIWLVSVGIEKAVQAVWRWVRF